MLALGVAEEAAWFGEAEVSAEEVGEWVDEEGGVGAGAVVLAGDRIAGFASPGRRGSVFLADPALTDPVADALLPWVRERRDDIQLITFSGDAARIAAYERHGLAHDHSSFTLARPDALGPLPDAPFPPELDVQPYAMGSDDEAIHRLMYVDAGWADVPGHTERTLDEWREVMGNCPSQFVARRDGRPVGWIAGRVLGSGRGYVQAVAVARSERRQGLGRALLVRGFTDLQESGAGDLALDVEARNASALGLYESLGFTVEREWQTFSSRGPGDQAG